MINQSNINKSIYLNIENILVKKCIKFNIFEEKTDIFIEIGQNKIGFYSSLFSYSSYIKCNIGKNSFELLTQSSFRENKICEVGAISEYILYRVLNDSAIPFDKYKISYNRQQKLNII